VGLNGTLRLLNSELNEPLQGAAEQRNVPLTRFMLILKNLNEINGLRIGTRFAILFVSLIFVRPHQITLNLIKECIMERKFKPTLSGTALALAAAGLMGCANAGTSTSTAAASAGVSAASTTTDLVHCYGVNTCKGHNDCKTAENACAGHAICKGHGFVAMPSKSCADIGGTIQDEWKGKVAVTSLSHCYDVNKCKGHNDCKTAENACAGKAACKGHGFVAMSEKACGDVAGKIGA